MLVIHLAFYPLFNVLCRDPLDGSGSTFINITVLCKPVGNFVSSGPNMPRYPIQCHCVLGRDIEHLLALLYQWRCVGSLNAFQSRLTVRAHTNMFLWPNVHLNFKNTGQDSIYLSLKNCSMFSREILSLLPKDFP